MSLYDNIGRPKSDNFKKKIKTKIKGKQIEMPIKDRQSKTKLNQQLLVKKVLEIDITPEIATIS